MIIRFGNPGGNIRMALGLPRGKKYRITIKEEPP